MQQYWLFHGATIDIVVEFNERYFAKRIDKFIYQRDRSLWDGGEKNLISDTLIFLYDNK